MIPLDELVAKSVECSNLQATQRHLTPRPDARITSGPHGHQVPRACRACNLLRINLGETGFVFDNEVVPFDVWRKDSGRAFVL
jgi:hypothetical protein